MRFDRVLAAELWHATTTELNPQQKGRLLELTVAYLFETLANFSARLRPRGLDSEFDLILRSRDPDAFLHREIGTYVLVE